MPHHLVSKKTARLEPGVKEERLMALLSGPTVYKLLILTEKALGVNEGWGGEGERQKSEGVHMSL